MLTRKTSVAWTFYPSDKNELKWLINEYMDNVSISEETTNLKAVVCPHAWYIYSWHIAAYSYKAMLDNLDSISKKTIVLLCPSHYVSLDKVAVWLYDELETPLGNLGVNKKLWEELINDYPEYFVKNFKSFEQEHSLEVQLPFLKYIFWERDVKILPLVFWWVDFSEVWKILNLLYKRDDLFFIVSSDLSHYKPYNEATSIDYNTLTTFLTRNSSIIAWSADACWIYPWITLNEIANSNNWNTKILKYLNSWDTAWDKNRVVWYASVIYT
jgi:AmmeMemoRadiSam system protein B